MPGGVVEASITSPSDADGGRVAAAVEPVRVLGHPGGVEAASGPPDATGLPRFVCSLIGEGAQGSPARLLAGVADIAA